MNPLLLKELDQLNLFLSQENQTQFSSFLSDPLFFKQIHDLLRRYPHGLPKPFKKFSKIDTKNFKPFKDLEKESTEHLPLAKEALKKGLVGAVILAGGDGSRLGSSLPKGLFAVTPFSKKSLFQLHCEKIAALQTLLDCFLPLAILTSEKNHEATIAFFKKHQFFGLCPSHVLFITQTQIPFYTLDLEWFLDTEHTLSMGPNGNGDLFSSLIPFFESFPALENLMVINVDNPLALAFDPLLIGHQLQRSHDVSLRCFYKDHPEEKVGVLALEKEKLKIIDYTQLADLASFEVGNMNIFCFSTKFIKKIAKTPLEIHWIEKQGFFYESSTKTQTPITFLKGEKFITDALEHASSISCIDTKKEMFFSPLKRAHGENDLISVQKALHKKEKTLFYNIYKKTLDAGEELSPQDYYHFLL